MKPSSLIALIVVLIIPVVAVIATREKKESNVNSTSSPTPSASATNYTVPSDAISAKKVILKTSKGNITLNMYADVAPLSVQNFVTLGKRGYYNGVVFHRIIEDFMIQSGDPTGTGTGGASIYGTGFKTETSDKKFVKGTLGMARTTDVNSNGSQFFIVTKSAQTSLDGKYTVFGQVADDASQAVVDAIAATPVTTSDSGEKSKPTETVSITGFEIVE